MHEHVAAGVGPDGVDIAFEHRGAAGDPAVLLIMGLAAQMVHWPDGFCDALVRRGLQVVRFDNRDAGRSTHMSGVREPDLAAVLGGDLSSAPYTLSHMAADAVGLMDALGWAEAHVVGASMGAAIAQTIAIEHPARVRSLTSMMWTTGDPSVGQMDPALGAELFGSPTPVTREESVARAVERATLVGSATFPLDEAEMTARAALAYDRDHDDSAPARQGAATVASGDRTELCASSTCRRWWSTAAKTACAT